MSPTHPFPTIPVAAPSPRPGIGAVLGRALVVGVVGAAVALLVDRLEPSVDANIGAGIAGLAAVLAVTTGWGLVDGWRSARGPEPYVLWVVVSIVAVLGTVVVATAAGTIFFWELGARDILGTLLMSAIPAAGAIPIVLGPAVVGVALGQLVGRRRS